MKKGNFFFFFMLINLSLSAQEPVIYGIVPDAYPTTFLNDDGQPDGFFVELISRIFYEEGIPLEIVSGPFAEIYDQLIGGEVHLFTSLGKSPERDLLFSYTQDPIFVTWNELFIHPNSSFSSIGDIRNKKIALVRGIIQSQAFISQMEEFSIPFEVLWVNGFQEAVELVSSGKAFGLVSYSLFISGRKEIIPSGYSFLPMAGYPATSRSNGHEAMMNLLGKKLTELKEDPNSYYYTLYDKWIRHRVSVLEVWVLPSLGILLSFLVMTLLFLLLLKKQVAIKTRELADLNQNLEQRVTERSDQLLKISEIVDQAERMNTISRVIASMAHEMGTPLGNAITSASILYNDLNQCMEKPEMIKDQDIKNHYRLLESNLHRVDALIDRFKALVASPRDDEPILIDLQEYFDQMNIYFVKRFALEPGDIQWDISQGSILTFPGALTSIIENILQNSLVHAYPKQEKIWVMIRIRLGHKKNPNKLSLVIEDKGQGMEELNLAKAFEPFFTTKKNMSMLGLGLTTVYNTVKNKFQGEITLESQKGEGTKVTAVLSVRRVYS